MIKEQPERFYLPSNSGIVSLEDYKKMLGIK